MTKFGDKTVLHVHVHVTSSFSQPLYYYSGHRQYHAIHTQIIVDNCGMIRYIQSGFLGHLIEAQQFALMDQLGTDLEFPDNCYLLGDKIYPNRGNVVTQVTAQQIAREPGNQRRKCLYSIGSFSDTGQG